MTDESQGHSTPGAGGTTASTDEPTEDDRAPNTLLNAVIGGLAGIVLAAIPFSTVLGGGIAGYLEGGDSRSGAKVGAIAGLVAFVPFIFLIVLALVFVPVLTVPGAPIHFALWVSVLLIVLLAALYTVGLSALGGVLGVYVKNEV